MMLRLLKSALLLGSTVAATAQTPLKTVEHVDLDRYLGRWYEIARTPNPFEKKCDRDVTAEYARTGDRISVRNTCLKQDGTATTSKGRAKVADPATNAKLKVSFFWPFYGNYWIIALDPDYRWAVVGEPSRRYLWILSRTPLLPDDTIRSLHTRIAEAGYNVSSLITTRQTSR